MKTKIIRSPFFYVGDKYKLMTQLKDLMPDDIKTYIEPFMGGGSSLINTKAVKYIGNDIDKNIINLHKFLFQYKNNFEKLLDELLNEIKKYNLSCSYNNITVPKELKEKYPKTYYSKYNKKNYEKMRVDFNGDKNNIKLLYLCLIYGFNHMIRFNKSQEFNLPVGNVDFNKNVYEALKNYIEFISCNSVALYNNDYETFLNSIEINKNDYVYFDPPYLISQSEYNKLWNEEKEVKLYKQIDKLNEKGVKFGITNLVSHKGISNTIFLEWAKKYHIYEIKSNYISYNDNSIKKTSREIFVTNYEKHKK